jgi:cytidylate kinase
MKVVPILTLPGWFVTNRAKPKMFVLAPTAIRAWVMNERAEALSRQLMDRVAARLEEKCRDVEL